MPLELIHSVENETRKNDALALLPLMEKWTGYASYKMGSMIGFGQYHYQYDSGREGDFFVTGFSPRKQNLAIYIMPGLAKYPELLNKLGKHKLGKSCLYVNKLADIDLSILERLVVASVEDMQEKYTCIDIGRL
ncbi:MULTISPECIES: DUF1801 domain-containing protein [Alteromonadaceae]|jgi:hypothetical protein|uniref:DUF1801 domain-containing protein n=1 Tax=Brumicola blandensis TaxID=3075611 RepID=A0AAW8R1I8_9ALTE|nr:MULTISPECIES: DUF1801 domain-containing protein [unclassified Alteromonas]MDT0583136.1 DUF1801 domain-containing protein [Alteromonas sp. W409]MDT0627441.1 DUF1801 domain-containing protein [Alteromonas sp. W364]